MIDLSKITTLDEVIFKGSPSEFFQRVADKFENNVATEFEKWSGKWCFEMSKNEEKLLKIRYKLELLRKALK
mgnify:CR=1 FL=1